MVKIILSDSHTSIVVMDSVAYMNESQKGNVIVCGSHGGESAARQVLRFNPSGVIFNDAGKGKEDAGISGLKLCDEAGIPAAAIDTFSARIGDGMDTYESGIVSAVNDEAVKCGISVGMAAKGAALKMLRGR